MAITNISTLHMTHDEWLEQRREGIGGSDSSTVVGLNPYSSQYELWADKLGMLPPKEENEAMRIGHDLEEYVAERFCEAAGKKVRRKNAIIRNSDYPFAHANVDRLVCGESAGLECKTTSLLNLDKFRNREFPPVYYVQCQHYMMVTGMPKWYLAVLVMGREFLWFEIERDDEDIAALAQAEEEFWKHVTERTEPPIDGSKSCTNTIGTLFGESDNMTADLSMFRDTLSARANTVAQIKELEELRDKYDNEIKAFMQECETGSCEGFKVTWKQQTRRTFDHKRFAADHPELDLSGYYKQSASRIYRFKEEK